MVKIPKVPRTPKIHIVLDTNALFTEAADKLLSTDISALINDELKTLGLEIHWYIPSSVKAERRHQMLERGKGLLIPLGRLEALLGHSLAMTSDVLALRVDEAIQRSMISHRLEELPLDVDKVDWPALIERAVTKRPPFSSGSEKGFKDSIVLEAFSQLTLSTPRSPASCRVVFLTGDAILQEAARERAAGLQNVTIAGDLSDLKTLLNAVAAHLPQEAVEELIPKAAIMFWDHSTKEGLYSKFDIYKKLNSPEFADIVQSKPDSFSRSKWKSISIHSTTFIEKQGQRVKFSTSILVNVESSKVVNTDNKKTSEYNKLISNMSMNSDSPDIGINALRMVNINRLAGLSVETLMKQGSHRFSVNWESTLNQRGYLINPALNEIIHNSTNWESSETETPN